ncbi:acyltransferase [Capnocytophaga sp. HP1101]
MNKPHYMLLDGLRGVAALMVLWYHIFEAHATSPIDQTVNHGYLMVDFFFVLSGFVVGYAYNDRWGTMSIGTFLKRRLIRLHPMVIFGALLGAGLFYLQGCEAWDVSRISVGALIGATLLNLLMIPATPSIEARGIGEMYPLNGPTWSLFFEYMANLLYAFVLRLLSTRTLAFVVAIFGISLGYLAIFGDDGYLGYGWSMTSIGTLGGSLRVLFSFGMGLLLSRVFKPARVKYAFWIGAVLLIGIALIPRVGGTEKLWANGIYDTLCVVLIFPLIVYFAASDRPKSALTHKLCKFLGELSYPLYMVHYPFIYWYYAWVKNEQLSFSQSVYGALAVVIGSILLAYIVLKVYDEPIRKYLSRSNIGKR